MSHFTCLVIGENVEEQLEPYYELECSLSKKEIKDDPRSEFKSYFESYEELEKDWEDYKKKHPDDNNYEDINEYLEEYHDYHEHNGKYGIFTNPNSKWDWYSIGGRWKGFFKAKKELKFPDDIMNGSGSLIYPSEQKKGYYDSIRKCDIDFDGMEKDSILKNEKLWNDAFKKYPDNDKNENVINRSFIYGIEKGMKKEEYINKYSNFSTYAVLMDGKWYEKGEMGWWAISTSENPDWQNEFNKLIKSLPEDELLTIVDCHI